MNDLVIALGLVLVIEGVLYAAAPDHLKRIMVGLQETPSERLRAGGLAAMGIGLIIVWAARSFLGSS